MQALTHSTTSPASRVRIMQYGEKATFITIYMLAELESRG